MGNTTFCTSLAGEELGRIPSWMLQPGAEREGVGLGVLRMIKPWHEWMLMWGYEVAVGPPTFTDEFIRELAVKLVGTDDFEMKVSSASPWTVNHQFATTIARGRVFCAGDAVHRHPPTNGLGSNTSIQDSYNLAWKLAHVVAGTAAPSLLASYDAERAPIARQIVERANQSIVDTGKILTALDLTDTTDVTRLERQLALRKEGQPYEDPYGTWASLRDDGGVLLVRPDLYIAARQLTGPSSPGEAHQWLAGVLSSVLGRPVTASRSA